jgi:hypothetical protein
MRILKRLLQGIGATALLALAPWSSAADKTEHPGDLGR